VRRRRPSLAVTAAADDPPGDGPFGTLSIGNVFRRAWWPYQTVLGRVPGVPGYRDVGTYPDAERLPGCVLFRFDAPLFFANARTFRDQVRRLARSEPAPRWIVVAAEPITDVDTTAADMLEDLDEALNARGISLVFADMKDPVREKIERYELTRTIDPAHFSPPWAWPWPRSRTSSGPTGPPPPANRPDDPGLLAGQSAQGYRRADPGWCNPGRPVGIRCRSGRSGGRGEGPGR
jgi:anti-anti-sigma regulatory factor